MMHSVTKCLLQLRLLSGHLSSGQNLAALAHMWGAHEDLYSHRAALGK